MGLIAATYELKVYRRKNGPWAQRKMEQPGTRKKRAFYSGWAVTIPAFLRDEGGTAARENLAMSCGVRHNVHKISDQFASQC